MVLKSCGALTVAETTASSWNKLSAIDLESVRKSSGFCPQPVAIPSATARKMSAAGRSHGKEPETRQNGFVEAKGRSPGYDNIRNARHDVRNSTRNVGGAGFLASVSDQVL